MDVDGGGTLSILRQPPLTPVFIRHSEMTEEAPVIVTHSPTLVTPRDPGQTQEAEAGTELPLFHH